MTAVSLLALVVLVICVPLNWYITYRLWRLTKAMPDNAVLRERSVAALAIAILVTVFAAIFLNNDLLPPIVAFEDTKIVTRTAVLMVGFIPAGYWLWLYRRH